LKHMRAKAPGELTSVKDLATAYGVPFDAASRVMQMLAQAGVLISEQGAHGGYMIGRDLNRVSFAELSEILLGKVAVARCLSETSEDKEPACAIRGSCNIVSPVQMLNRKLNEFYRGLSIAELLGSSSKKVREPQMTEAEAEA
jgi:Rrf2 family protein